MKACPASVAVSESIATRPEAWRAAKTLGADMELPGMKFSPAGPVERAE